MHLKCLYLKLKNAWFWSLRCSLNKDRLRQQHTQWPVVSSVLDELVEVFPYRGQDKQQKGKIAEHTTGLFSSAALVGCLRSFSLAGQYYIL